MIVNLNSLPPSDPLRSTDLASLGAQFAKTGSTAYSNFTAGQFTVPLYKGDTFNTLSPYMQQQFAWKVDVAEATPVATTSAPAVATAAGPVATPAAKTSAAAKPKTHASSHAAGGTDPLTLSQSQVTNLATDLAAKASAATVSAHVADTANPHGVTKAQVGLGNCDNTADSAKPVSTAQQAALDLKAPLGAIDPLSSYYRFI